MNNANETAVKKRGWIKNIAIIFLVILLLLTFFSNTIMTYSLPEVSAQYGQYSSLSSSVKLKGNVKANESYKVVYEPTEKDSVVQSRKIKSVYVREGDYVSKDQEILVLEGGASEELKNLQDQYDSLKNQYDLALSGDNVSYLQNTRELESAQKSYDDAKKEYDRLSAKYTETMNGAENETDKDKRTEEIKAERKKLSAEIAELEEKITGLQTKLEAAKVVVGDGVNGNLAEEEIKFAEIENTYKNLKENERILSGEVDNLSKSVEDMRKANGFTNEIISLNEENAGLYADYPNNIAQIMENNGKIADAKKKLEILGLTEVTDIELFRAEHNLETVTEKHDTASKALTDYSPFYDDAKAKIEALRKTSTASDEINEYTSLIEMYSTQLEDKKKAYDDTLDVDELITALTKAEEAMKDEKSSLDILRAQTNKENTSTNLERKDQQKKLAELSEKIEKYKNAPETLSVTAPISGRVVSIYCVPGDSVSSGSTVADIEIADKGYTCEVTVSSDEARKIAVGSPVTISNSWWYSNVEASIVQIRSDVQSQGKNKIVIFEVKGDVYEGQELSFSVGDRSASYDNVFPNSALHDDNEGKYVLVVDAKKTPLGMRYKARRVQVEVVASDDTQSSISGLMGGEFVITNATTPIADGQMVRLAEN